MRAVRYGAVQCRAVVLRCDAPARRDMPNVESCRGAQGAARVAAKHWGADSEGAEGESAANATAPRLYLYSPSYTYFDVWCPPVNASAASIYTDDLLVPTKLVVHVGSWVPKKTN